MLVAPGKMTIRAAAVLGLALLGSCAGDSPPAVVLEPVVLFPNTGRPGQFMLQVQADPGPEFNYHRLRFQTETYHDLIFLDVLRDEIPGELISVGARSTRPKGSIRLTADKVIIDLEVAAFVDGKPPPIFKKYRFNGTYALKRISGPPWLGGR